VTRCSAIISNELGVLQTTNSGSSCVEGPTDVTFLKNLSITLNQHDANLPNLSIDYRIATLPLGVQLIQWVDNHYLRNLGLPEIHIYDRDTAVPPKYQTAVNTVNARNENLGCTYTKRELENYIHPDAVVEYLVSKSCLETMMTFHKSYVLL